MKKIACIGYHATGAGVIDDLFREFDNVTQGLYDVECRVLQDPDGIADLEYNLVENPHRLNSGFALKRFLRYVDRTNRTYKKIFGPRWKEISRDYVNSLVEFEFDGYWHGDIWLLPKAYQYYHLFRRGMSKIAPKKFKKPACYNYFPFLKSYHVCIDEERFLEATRDYMDKLCEAMNPEGKEYVMLDQLYAPGNVARYSRYMRDTKAIIVDRDPRDVYIRQQIVNAPTLPSDPRQFARAFKDARIKTSEALPEECLYVTFEDLMFDYDATIKKVIDFVGIDERHHVNKKAHFDPAVSSKNTRIWEWMPEYAEAARIIAEEIPEFTHNFDKY